MAELISKVQFQVKKSSSDLTTYIFRVLTGSWIGMVFAHVFQMIFEYKNFMFFFVIVLMTGAILRVTRGWSFFSVVILNAFCVLLGVLLKMYITVAPGA